MQKPGHLNNPATVALDRQVTSEMARWAKYKASFPLLCIVWLACGQSAFGQGSIYSYNFTGDTSPLRISAAFTATEEAVATGLLSTGYRGSISNLDLSGAYVQMGDRRVPMWFAYVPVLPGTGEPVATLEGRLYIIVGGSFGINDEVDIEGGASRRFPSDPPSNSGGGSIWRYIYPGDPQYYTTEGMWIVTIIPEPCPLPLILLTITGWQARRLLQGACR